MNYIRKLQLEAKEQKEKLLRIEQKLTNLIIILDSTKYNCGDLLDNYINTKDVRNLVVEIKREVY